jgi:hypothetical protein
MFRRGKCIGGIHIYMHSRALSRADVIVIVIATALRRPAGVWLKPVY